MYNTTPHPLADTSDSPSEYAVALQKKKKRRLRTTYDLVRDKVPSQRQSITDKSSAETTVQSKGSWKTIQTR